MKYQTVFSTAIVLLLAANATAKFAFKPKNHNKQEDKPINEDFLPALTDENEFDWDKFLDGEDLTEEQKQQFKDVGKAIDEGLKNLDDYFNQPKESKEEK